MRITLEVFGDVQFDREMLGIERRAVDLTPALNLIRDDFYVIEKAQFASEGGRGSGGWAQLKPSTIAARGSAHPILKDTGAMRKSLTARNQRNSICRIRPDSIEIGSKDPKVPFHQHGTRKMTRRRPVELTEMDRRRWTKILQTFLMTGGTNGRRRML